jgi:hypothetical protein
MEGPVALSLACNVLQIVDTVRIIISTATEIRSSVNGTTNANQLLEKAGSQMRSLALEIQQEEKDPVLQDIALRWHAASEEHLAILSTLKRKGANSFFEAIWSAAKAIRKRRDLEESQTRLDRLSLELNTYFTATYLPSMDGKLDLIRIDADIWGNKTEQRLDDMKQQLKRVGNIMAANLDAINTTKDLTRQLLSWQSTHKHMERSKQCLQALYFPKLRERQDRVATAHCDTFKWIFDPTPGTDMKDGAGTDRFRLWLLSDNPSSNTFWIFGKPGAGKSTLMKFIANVPTELQKHLQIWSQGRELIIAQYYFWRSGDEVQRSLKGVLRSLIYQILVQRPDFIKYIFLNKEWLNAGPSFEFSQDSLLEGLADIIQCTQQQNLRLFILIDGLDEFDNRGDADKDEVPGVEPLLAILYTMWSQPSVKLCVSSRPLPQFVAQMKGDNDHCMHLHELTRKDIIQYIEKTLNGNPAFQALASRDQEYTKLVTEITDAAKGVFFWVSLVCRTLLEGIENEDHISTLRERVQSLPPKLNSLFKHILDSVETRYRRVAAQWLLLASTYHQYEYPLGAYLTLENSFSIESFWNSCMDDDRLMQLSKRATKMINARCKLLLEIHVPDWDMGTSISQENLGSPTDASSEQLDAFASQTVGFAHRTVVDFLLNDTTHRRLLTDAVSTPLVSPACCKSSLAMLAVVALYLSNPSTPAYNNHQFWKPILRILHTEMVQLGSCSSEVDEAVARVLWSDTQKVMSRQSRPGGLTLLQLVERASEFERGDIASRYLKRHKGLTMLDLTILYSAAGFIKI